MKGCLQSFFIFLFGKKIIQTSGEGNGFCLIAFDIPRSKWARVIPRRSQYKNSSPEYPDTFSFPETVFL